MNAAIANLINALVLIGLGLWGFLSQEKIAYTALIPVAFGAVLLAMYPGIKSHNKTIAHIAVLLTLILIPALIFRLIKVIGKSDWTSVGTTSLMVLTCVLAMVFFVKSFIDARKARESADLKLPQ